MGYQTKTAVTKAFSAAADTYNQGADVQREVAEHLTQRIRSLPLPQNSRILEIGCGTGFLSRALTAMSPSDLLLTDISEAMLARCREALGPQNNAHFLAMDGEHPTVAAGFDLICSSLAFQWFDNLPTALARLAALLKPGGHMAFATLGADSFAGWKRTYADLNVPSAMRSYPTTQTLASLLPPSAGIDEEHLTRPYADGYAFLDELKLIGAHLPEESHRPLTAGALRRVLRAFEGGVDVTYHVIYGTWRV